ncbi:type II toxin-antitoxin system PrlF family antitoxin [Pseudomonas mohnii]|uniref:type II toxin-antitoxin system PrlF family antitoxin n=1 Tax=Pseudomonas mohnii TaxID=395600 RepID=UPI001A1B56EB|nr:type II toxin-antitoxin system PrlF family antitoxin [Pseudomonas mohnii]
MNAPHAPIISMASCTDGDLEVPTDLLEQGVSVNRILNFLATDINAHPERLLVVDSRLVERINSLLLGIEVDLDAPLQAEDE